MPELVFFNCCHLGRVDEPTSAAPAYGQVASSVAEVLMTSGIRAVVAAGWAVNDVDAVEFAGELYGALLSGHAFGDATREARTRIYLGPGDSTSPKPRSSTWGAYQCYGEPGFRLTVGVRDRFDASTSTLVLRADVDRRLAEIAAEAGDVRSPEERTEMRDRLGQRLADIISTAEDGKSELKNTSWAAPSTWAKLGAAQAELGDFAGAIASLERALDGQKSSYPVETVESLANLKVRQAQKLCRADRDHGVQAVELFEQADQLLTALLSIRRTPERLALRASYHKKRAATLFERRGAARPSAEQEAELLAARDAYREAAGRSHDKYHLLNDLQLSGLLGEAQLDEVTSRIEEAFAPGARDDLVQAEFTGYWDRVADADRLLTTRLLEGGLADCATELHDAFDAVFRERSTWKQRDSTIDHLWDLSRLHAEEAEATALDDLWRRLRQEWQGDQ
jgi:hypothetical protein